MVNTIYLLCPTKINPNILFVEISWGGSFTMLSYRYVQD